MGTVRSMSVLGGVSIDGDDDDDDDAGDCEGIRVSAGDELTEDDQDEVEEDDDDGGEVT